MIRRSKVRKKDVTEAARAVLRKSAGLRKVVEMQPGTKDEMTYVLYWHDEKDV